MDPRTPPRTTMGLRPSPGVDPDAPLPTSDPALLARVVAEIRSSGPMSFARFMALALYDPDGGYYTAGPGGPGGDGGDFLTAPEGHPIFGRTLAVQVAESWERSGRPDPFVIREHGAGRGALAAALLDGLRRDAPAAFAAVRYQPMEASAARLEVLRARLEAAGLADRLDAPDDLPAPGVIVANELVDALPVHAIEGGSAGTPLERYVVEDPAGREGLGWVVGPPSTPAIAARLAADGVTLEPGQRAEVCLELDDWVTRAAALLSRGLAIVIDYGHPAASLYDPARGSLLRAYHRHRVHDDPLVAVGRQDLTAHVDLSALDRAFAAAGLVVLGGTTQAEFLAGLGIGDGLVAMQTGPDARLPDYLAARAAVVSMLDPGATGRFAVRLYGRDLAADPPLRGLAFRLGSSGRPA